MYSSEDDETVITVTRFQEGTEDPVDPNKTYTKLKVGQRGTLDGGILWKLINDLDTITYDWNSYVTFSHELEILEN